MTTSPDLEALRALVAEATALQKQLDDGDGAYPQDYHDIFGKLEAALPALERLLAGQRDSTHPAADPQAFWLPPGEGRKEMVVLASHYSKPSEYPDALAGWNKSGWVPLYAAPPVQEAAREPEASSVCPICGKDSPHYHKPEEATLYNAKFVGVGPQFVQDALQHVYAAMDAMRRKGAREGYDRGYNAGFNVSADILEAALKQIKSKLGWMAERTGEFPPIVFDAEASANPVAEPASLGAEAAAQLLDNFIVKHASALLSQEPSSGEDWVMVPREPTDRMLSAAQIAGAGRALTNAEIYRAMLSAGEADWDVETAGIRHKLPKLD